MLDDLTPFKGTPTIKVFYKCAYSSRNIFLVKRICSIGPFKIYWIINPKRDEDGSLSYKEKHMEKLGMYVDIKKEVLDLSSDAFGPELVGRKCYMYRCSSKQDGSYVGPPEEAWKYVFQRGIESFYKTKEDHKTASIGFCPDCYMWYGWSHRAIYGFKVGDILKEGELGTYSSDLDENTEFIDEIKENLVPVGFECKTLYDCKKAASAFAFSV